MQRRVTYKSVLLASIRGDEVAFLDAVKKRRGYEGPWKTNDQLWHDAVQNEKEESLAGAGIIGNETLRQETTRERSNHGKGGLQIRRYPNPKGSAKKPQF